ncbi:MAG: YkgJ family cysteine cluster protein [Bacteriovorax sp.]|jgi:Fe-S-cluster containining protein
MQLEDLSNNILIKFKEISETFGGFQQRTKLRCPEGCGKCCFKPEISCSPFELLPLAFHLLKDGRAVSFLDNIKSLEVSHCPLLEVTNAELGYGRCTEYEYRPFLCRAFGVTARHGKNSQIDYSVCKVLQEDKIFSADFMSSQEEIPFMNIWKKRFESLDPHLQEKEVPIKEGLIFMLEKVLLWDSLQKT